MSDAPRPPWLSRWDLLPLLSALALAAALPWFLKGLPDPLPTHFDSRGQANGWTSHAAFPWIGFGLPAFVWLVLLLTGRATVGTSQDPDGRKSAATVPLRGLLTTGVLALMGATPLIPRFGLRVMGWMMGLLAGLFALGLTLMVRRLRSEGLTGPSDHYRWGLFYVNQTDPRIWVPKSVGVGWTLNFSHAMSWLLLVLMLLPVLLLAGWGLFHR